MCRRSARARGMVAVQGIRVNDRPSPRRPNAPTQGLLRRFVLILRALLRPPLPLPQLPHRSPPYRIIEYEYTPYYVWPTVPCGHGRRRKLRRRFPRNDASAGFLCYQSAFKALNMKSTSVNTDHCRPSFLWIFISNFYRKKKEWSYNLWRYRGSCYRQFSWYDVVLGKPV